MASARAQCAFTLIELLIVSIMLVVLLAMAHPAYEAVLLKGRRLAAAALLQEAWARQESYRQRWGSYALAMVDLGLPEPSYVTAEGLVAEPGGAYYQMRLEWQGDKYQGISLEPISRQRRDACASLSVDLAGSISASGEARCP